MAVIFSNAVATKEYEIATSSAAFEILSDGIYQHKEAAVIRELCTNAYDAHVSCGKQDIPFRVRIPTSLRPVFEVEDFGVGMSHEDVLNIYSSYFRSTKKQCLNSVGEKGLGSKTPLAIAKSFNVRSRKDGTETLYSVVMSDGVPSVMTLNSAPCTTCNGTLVSVSVPTNMHSTFLNEAKALLCTYKVAPVVEGLNKEDKEKFDEVVGYNREHLDETKEYNVVKLLANNSPFHGSYLERYGLLFVRLGPVLYPLGNDLSKFLVDMDEDDVRKIVNFFTYMDISVTCKSMTGSGRGLMRRYNSNSNYIVFNFNPKDLKTVTSRESIAMSQDNIKTIADKLLYCASKFVDSIESILDNSTNVIDAIRNVCNYGSGNSNHLLKMAQKLDDCFKFKGKGIIRRLESRLPIKKLSITKRYSGFSSWGKPNKTEMDRFIPNRASLLQFGESTEPWEMKIFYSDKYKSRRMASAVIRCVQQNKELFVYSIEKDTLLTERERIKLGKLLTIYGVKHVFVKVEDYMAENNVIWTQSTKNTPKKSSLSSCEGRIVTFKSTPDYISATTSPWATLKSVTVRRYNLIEQAKDVEKMYIVSVLSAKYTPYEISAHADKKGDTLLAYLTRSDQFVKDVESGMKTFSVFVPNKLEYKRLTKSGSLNTGNILDITPIVMKDDTPEMVEHLKTACIVSMAKSRAVSYNYSGDVISQELLFNKAFLDMLNSCVKISSDAKKVLTILLSLCKVGDVRTKLINDYCSIPYEIRALVKKSPVETEDLTKFSSEVLCKYPLLREINTAQNIDHIKIYVDAVNMLKEESK